MTKKSAAGPGKKSQALARRAGAVLFPNYGPREIAFARGKGPHVWDADGRRYLDFFGGVAVTALGHSHPAVTAAIRKQAGVILHCSNHYLLEPQIRLAEELIRRSFADRAFFCNSGTEAVEAALKLVRRWGSRKGGGRFEVLVARDGFHGRTLGALSATAKPKYQEGFGPLVPGFVPCTFNDLDSFRRAAGPQACAILIEPVQGEGGVHVATREFLGGLRKLCDEKDMLLVFDEVQTGMGRTGSLFAYEQYGLAPDVLCLAKALGNGVPVGAVLAKADLSALLVQGSHGSTFGGNFLACAAALASLREIAKPRTLANARRQGAALRSGLEEIARRFPGRVREIRGMGLLVGLELSGPAEGVIKAARARGLVVGSAGPNTLRFAPPLLVRRAQVREALSILNQAMEAAGR